MTRFISFSLTVGLRYFARCWTRPQPTESGERYEQQEIIAQRLAKLHASPADVVAATTLAELQSIVPVLYSSAYPHTLTHGDFSKTNVLIDEDKYEITGIVDWSLATVQPFGFDLDCLYLMTGYMDMSGWHNFTCRPRLLEEFWDEFWRGLAITDGDDMRREDMRATAEAAAKISAILRYAFARNADGSNSDNLATSDTMQTMLKAWLGDVSGRRIQ